VKILLEIVVSSLVKRVFEEISSPLIMLQLQMLKSLVCFPPGCCSELKLVQN